MAIARWQPFQEMETLRRQFDQLFDELAPISRDPITPMMKRTWAPAIELQATDAAIVLKAELPGIDAKDLDVQVGREAVSISGEYRTETKHEEQRFVRSEFRYGSFRRVVPLPVAVKNDEVQAEFKDGILTLTLPKVDAPKVVKLNLAGDAPVAIEPSPEAAPATEPTAESAHTDDVWAEPAQG